MVVSVVEFTHHIHICTFIKEVDKDQKIPDKTISILNSHKND